MSKPIITSWSDYELIDCGDFEKLERFGPYILRRPEPQALWDKKLSETEWEKMTHAFFKKEKSSAGQVSENEKGKWILKPGMPEQWFIQYQSGELKFSLRLGLTSFKHVGVFPEQASNWDWIFRTVKEIPVSKPRVLNLFAYTGGASLAACAAGADVYHLDSVKPVISWARQNMEASGLSNIHWLVEDSMKFLRREVKRGNFYHGIILDPPAYGRGPEGEKWILEDGMNELIKLTAKLASDSSFFLVLNMYSMGFSPLVAENLLKMAFPKHSSLDVAECSIASTSGWLLPLGIAGRLKKNT